MTWTESTLFSFDDYQRNRSRPMRIPIQTRTVQAERNGVSRYALDISFKSVFNVEKNARNFGLCCQQFPPFAERLSHRLEEIHQNRHDTDTPISRRPHSTMQQHHRLECNPTESLPP